MALQAMVCQETFPIQQWEEQYQATFGYDDSLCPPGDNDKEAEWLVGDEELLRDDLLRSEEVLSPKPNPSITMYAELEFLAGGGVLDHNSGFKLGGSFILRDQYCGRTEIPQNV